MEKNSATEYGSSDDENLNFYLTENWINKYGVTHGTRASDWTDKNLTKKNVFLFCTKIERTSKKKK